MESYRTLEVLENIVLCLTEIIDLINEVLQRFFVACKLKVSLKLAPI